LERLNGWIVHRLAQQIQQVHVAIPTRMMLSLSKLKRQKTQENHITSKGKMENNKKSSVVDLDPYVFGPPVSGSFHCKAKTSKKKLGVYCSATFFMIFYL
jgi:hypothetical protein